MPICRLAIAWMMMIITASLVNAVDRNQDKWFHSRHMVQKNVNRIESSLSESATPFPENLERTASKNRESFDSPSMKSRPIEIHQRKNEKKTLQKFSGPDISQDTDNLIDSDSYTPHVRVKRNSLNTNFNRHVKRPSPSYIDRHRTSRRLYKRFSSQETNPADESEAEYSNGFVEDDVDVPGTFLDDEIAKKRNRLEDIYPEVTDIPKGTLQRNNNPPEFLKPSNTNGNQIVREKRNGTGKKNNRENQDDEDCADAEDYYYEDDNDAVDQSETSELKDNKRATNTAIDYDYTNGKQETLNKASISIADDNIRNSKLTEENDKILYNQQNLNDNAQDFLRSPIRGKRLENGKEKSSVYQAAKRSSKHKKKKEKSKKKPTHKSHKKNPKQKSVQKLTEERIRPKLKPQAAKKSKSNSISKMEKRTSPLTNDGSNLKSSIAESKYVENDKFPGKSSNNQGQCHCSPVYNNKEKARSKSFVIKAVPYGKSKELQIFKKSDKSQKEISKKIDNEHKLKTSRSLSAPEEINYQSISEVKDLLGKLMMKVDNLNTMVTEMKDRNVHRFQYSRASNERSGKRLRFCPRDKSADLKWTPWTRWTGCSVTCGRGRQMRTRRCLECGDEFNSLTEERVCHLQECPPTKFLGIF